MNLGRGVVLTLFGIVWTSNAVAQEPAQQVAKQQVEQVLAEQAKAWNQGNIEGFMEGYAKLPALRFASGGTVTRGWQETLDRYRQHYPDRATMGTLSFADLETTLLSANAAVVFGRWKLHTEKGDPGGLFTLVVRKTDVGWRIVADHTSAAAPAN